MRPLFPIAIAFLLSVTAQAADLTGTWKFTGAECAPNAPATPAQRGTFAESTQHSLKQGTVTYTFRSDGQFEMFMVFMGDCPTSWTGPYSYEGGKLKFKIANVSSCHKELGELVGTDGEMEARLDGNRLTIPVEAGEDGKGEPACGKNGMALQYLVRQ